MTSTSFFARGDGLALAELAKICGGSLSVAASGDVRVTGIAALPDAGPEDVALFDNPRYRDGLAATKAGAVILSAKHAPLLPFGVVGIVVKNPSHGFTLAGRALFPAALRPGMLTSAGGIAPTATVDISAQVEDGVIVEAGAVVGPRAEIGRGTIVGCGAVVGPDCRIGRDCRIGPQTTVINALLGNRVILHPGVRIGQDGFGYSAGPEGLLKVVQIGRVVIQDDVELGANTTVDRGSVRDTVIGENTKIDNQVQVGHNVEIGRNCILVSQVAVAGSVTIGDGVVIGGQTVINGHATVGDGAQIAAISAVAGDVPPGVRWGGVPARPMREWLRELNTVRSMSGTRRVPGKQDE
ncbi:UDP-3-O-(3-hydroxymyristoyl)glucosamine N-acyltransferase [Consotaella salsifontis]|uniref:UDP-3-O-acylglucosamine N-acyltransferase n=1 Tax=Consotaella salsifontis TaxID=1365950 RepID=A0A1T4SZI0_9HYPH|nr:UDP-3-O-(3-hydroxymyristoyl)glucosamine N-acyltransferase [Consotaella salsifontis]SKA33644.1 UDP-3-O-[3-hydroxymyristoyl] glucosamine N-acyltransferase [Consotaella salsifontis]